MGPRTTGRLLLATVIAVLATLVGTWDDDGGAGHDSLAVVLPPATTPLAGTELVTGALDRALTTAELAAAQQAAVAAEAAALAAAAAEAARTSAPPPPRVPESAAANDPVPAPPPPPPTPPPPIAPSFQTKGEQALSLISYPWRSLGYEIVFFGPVEGLRAKILRLERRIEIYVRPRDDVRVVAFDIAHELGHAFDFVRMTKAERAEWMQVRAMPTDALWYGCTACIDYATPAGDWAESFAVWQVGGTSRSEMAPQPTADQLAVLARIAS